MNNAALSSPRMLSTRVLCFRLLKTTLPSSARSFSTFSKEVIDALCSGNRDSAKSKYEKLYKDEFVEGTQLLRNLATAGPPIRLTIPGSNGVPSNVSVVDFRAPVSDFLQLLTVDDASGYLYIRDFYPNLLATIWSTVKSALIGNPGTSKSWLQLYCLLACVNPAACGLEALPPYKYGSTEPPEVVIRQDGDTKMVVYFLKAQMAHEVQHHPDVLDCFDPEKTFYMYEPGESSKEPYWAPRQMRVLMTTSQNVSRYRHFVRLQAAARLYMPVYELDDLRSIAQHMGSDKFPDEEVKASYEEWGGIIRYVLPVNPDVVQVARSDRIEALNKFQPDSFLVDGRIRSKLVPHFIALLDVNKNERGDYNFRNAEADLVSYVIPSMRQMVFEKSIKSRKEILVDDDVHGTISKESREAFEWFVAVMLTFGEGVLWETKATGDNEAWKPFKLFLAGGIEIMKLDELSAVSGQYGRLQINTLYYPEQEDAPFVNFFFKIEEEGPLYCMQVTRELQPRKIKFSSFVQFVERLGMPWNEAHKIRYIYCPRPMLADTAVPKLGSVGSAEGEAKEAFLALQISVLRIPMDYSESYF